jgi:type IV secretory pathway VirB3-like protein
MPPILFLMLVLELFGMTFLAIIITLFYIMAQLLQEQDQQLIFILMERMIMAKL